MMQNNKLLLFASRVYCTAGAGFGASELRREPKKAATLRLSQSVKNFKS